MSDLGNQYQEQRQRVGLAIWRKVCSQPEAEWADLSNEEQDDAIEWADAAIGAVGAP